METILPKKTQKGIALAIVTGRGACPVQMIPVLSGQSWPTNTNYFILTVYGSETGDGRMIAVEMARQAKAKYIWYVDDDTVPPINAGRHLFRVLEEHGPPNGKVMVAGAIYTTRSSPPEPVVYRGQGEGPDYNWKVGEVFKCWGLGTGCMMVNMDLFDHLPMPWFKTINEADTKWSDDLYFCSLVEQAGFECMMHGGLLCHHYDMGSGIIYQLPRGSAPYVNRISEPAEAPLPFVPPQPSAYDLVFNPKMTQTETEWLIERAKVSENFAEIGVWKAITTRNMAKNSKAQIVGVDTFLGSAENLDPGNVHYEPKLKDPDWLLKQAQQSVAEFNGQVTLVRDQSEYVADRFPDGHFDTVFIDASHDYAQVLCDISAWKSKVKPGGMLCGHDYTNWPDVKRAVDELLPGAIAIPGTSIWTYKVKE